MLEQGDVKGTVQGTVVQERIVYVVNVDGGSFGQGAVTGNNPIRTVGTVTQVDDDFSLIGAALIKHEDGVYGTTNISTVSANNSIARRTAGGSLQATSYILGGNSSSEVLSISDNSLVFKTPGQGTILTAGGTSKPTILTGGNIVIGDLDAGKANESDLHESSIWGTTGGAESSPGAGDATTETSALASRWIYTSFIEALDEKGSASTGIAIGAGNGLPSGASDTIILVANGGESLVVNDGSSNFNTNLEVAGSVLVTGGNTFEIKKLDNTSAFLVDGSDGDTTVAGTLNSSGNLGTGGSLTVDDGATFGGGFDAESGGTSISATGTIQTNGDLEVDGNTLLNGDVDLGSSNADEIAVNGYVTTNFIPISNLQLDLGSDGRRWDVVYAATFTGTSTTAKYADLAENYQADAQYEPGTVVVLGGDAEVTVTQSKGDHRVAGVVTTNPAHLMNAELQGENVVGVALTGRVPCKVLGRVKKGDILVTSAIPGYACVKLKYW